jgi:hypothetical protein
MITVSYYLPSPKDLVRCLRHKKANSSADRVLVVFRDTDTDIGHSSSVNPNFGLAHAKVKRSGVVSAMNAGFRCASGDISQFTDADATPSQRLAGTH